MELMKKIGSALSIWPSSIQGDFKKIQTQIDKENRKFGIVWTAAQVVLWGIVFIMSLNGGLFAPSRFAYGMTVTVCAVTMLCLLFLVPGVPALNRPLMYFVMITFLGASLWISLIQLQENARTAILFVAVLIVPVMFICDTLPVILLLMADVITFCIVAEPLIDEKSFEWAATNLIIFATAGILIGYFVNKARVERYVFAESAVQLAELQKRYAYYDQMTGLHNRRAYSERIDAFSKDLPDRCCVVMADINGLKEANDTYGHDAGDELIIGAAECLKRGFEDAGTVYRLGGDEFGVIMTGTEKDAQKCIKRMEELCSVWNGKTIKNISLSYGVASSEEYSDIDSLTKAADGKMYEFKQNYYLSSGKERRRR